MCFLFFHKCNLIFFCSHSFLDGVCFSTPGNRPSSIYTPFMHFITGFHSALASHMQTLKKLLSAFPLSIFLSPFAQNPLRTIEFLFFPLHLRGQRVSC